MFNRTRRALVALSLSAALCAAGACQWHRQVPEPLPTPKLDVPPNLTVPVTKPAEVLTPLAAAGTEVAASATGTASATVDVKLGKAKVESAAAASKEKPIVDQLMDAAKDLAHGLSTMAETAKHEQEAQAQQQAATLAFQKVVMEHAAFESEALRVQTVLNAKVLDQDKVLQARDKQIKDMQDAAIKLANDLAAKAKAAEVAWYTAREHLLLTFVFLLSGAAVAVRMLGGAATAAIVGATAGAGALVSPLVSKVAGTLTELLVVGAVFCGIWAGACMGIASHIDRAEEITGIGVLVCVLGAIGWFAIKMVGKAKVQAAEKAMIAKAHEELQGAHDELKDAYQAVVAVKDEAVAKADGAVADAEQAAKDLAAHNAVLEAIAEITKRADLNGDGVFDAKDLNVSADRVSAIGGHEARALFLSKFAK